MDNNSYAPEVSLSRDALELVARALDDLDRDLDTIMVVRAAEGEVVLDEIAAQLFRCHTRVLRVAAPSLGSLTLAGLLTRLRPAIEGVEQAPEQAIKALTQLDSSCDRIVLLVSSAETLERSALRAIQLAAEAQPKLRLMLAGTPALLEVLKQPDLNLLCSRLNLALGLPEGEENNATVLPYAGPALPASLKPVSTNDTNRITRIVAAAVVTLAAAGFGIFFIHTGADTAGIIRTPAAQLANGDAEPARPQAQSPAQPALQDLPQPLTAMSKDPEPPPPATPSALPELVAVPPAANPQVASESASAAQTSTAPAPSKPADAVRALPEPQAASIVPRAPTQRPAPAVTAKPPATSQQASLQPPLKHSEPTPRRPAAPGPRYVGQRTAGAGQPEVNQAYGDWNGRAIDDAQSLWLRDHPSYRRPDQRPPVRYEPRQQQDGSAWPLPAYEPRGTIGIYSGSPGGIRSFRSGSGL